MSNSGNIKPKSTVGGWIVADRQTLYLNQYTMTESSYHAFDTFASACSESYEATKSEENDLERFPNRMTSLYGETIKEDSRQYRYFRRGYDVASPELAQFLKSINLTPRSIHSIHEVVWQGMDNLSRNHELIDPNKNKNYPLTRILVKFWNSGKLGKVWAKRAVSYSELFMARHLPIVSSIWRHKSRKRREWRQSNESRPHAVESNENNNEQLFFQQ